MALHTNKTMYLHRLGDLIRIQVFQNGKPDPHMLTIELTSGSISLSDSNKALNEELGSEKILGIFGLQKLVNGYALAVITGVKKVSEYEYDTEQSICATAKVIVIMYCENVLRECRKWAFDAWVERLAFSKSHELTELVPRMQILVLFA